MKLFLNIENIINNFDAYVFLKDNLKLPHGWMIYYSFKLLRTNAFGKDVINQHVIVHKIQINKLDSVEQIVLQRFYKTFFFTFSTMNKDPIKIDLRKRIYITISF